MPTATVKKKAPKSTAFSRLKKKKGQYCKGKATKADVNKAATAYKKDAIKKGKSKTDATKIANAVLRGGCKMSSVAGKKKKTAVGKKRKTVKRK